MKDYNLWHPLSSISSGEDNLNIVSGKCIYLKDSRGKTYIDGLCGLWNMSLGYGNQKIIDKVMEQMKQLAFVNICEFCNDTVSELASQIVRILDCEIKKCYLLVQVQSRTNWQLRLHENIMP